MKESPKQELSKNVMSMKFMRRKEETDVQTKDDANKRRRLLDNQYAAPAAAPSDASAAMDVDSSVQQHNHNRSASLICTVEMVDLYSALPGRRSFGGFNKIVERNYAKLMDLAPADDGLAATADEEKILQQYEQMVSLPRGPNQGKAKKREHDKGQDNAGGGRQHTQQQKQKAGPGTPGGPVHKQARIEISRGDKPGSSNHPKPKQAPSSANPYLPSKFGSSKGQGKR